jgi:hypothetical protein
MERGLDGYAGRQDTDEHGFKSSISDYPRSIKFVYKFKTLSLPLPEYLHCNDVLPCSFR